MVLYRLNIFSKGGTNMHKWAKEIMECVKTKVNAKGLDNIQMEELEELKCWSEVAKNIAEYDYYYHITEAMEKPENEYGVNYDENGRYYTQPRNRMGEFTRRSYVHDPNVEHYRDMDTSMGRMYYSDDGMNNSYRNGRGYSESRYDMARRGYEESKKMNPSTDNMTAMERILEVIEEDVKELKPMMTSNEKSVARTKLTNMANMMM